MNQRLIVITKKFLFYFFISFPFYSSSYIDQSMYLDKLFDAWKLIAAVVILFLLPRIEISLPTIMVIALEIFLVAVTFMRGADLKRAIMTALPIICMMLVYELGKYDIKEFIRTQYFIFSLLIYSNFVCEIIFPHGMFVAELTHYWQNWLLGYYNNHSLYFIPAVSIALIYGKLFDSKVSVNILIITIFISAALIKSGGVIVTLVCMMLYLYLLKDTKIVNYFSIWIGHFAFFVVIIIMHSTRSVQVVFRLSEQLVKKGRSFRARYELWKRAILHICKHPILGHGIENQKARLLEYGWGLHAHNLVLEILHQGGIIYFIVFATLIILSGKKLLACQSKDLKISLTVAFLGWAVATLIEPFVTVLLMPLFFLAYNCEKIEECIEKKNIHSEIETDSGVYEKNKKRHIQLSL